MTVLKVKYANDGSYGSIERQLEGLATKFFARASAIGIAMDRDDIVQELRIAYLKAKSKWTPDGGARFSTYFQTCACRHFNARIEKEENERANLGMGSMSALMVRFGAHQDDQEVMPHSIETTMGLEESPEDARERQQEMRARLAGLSPEARKLVVGLLVAEQGRADVSLRNLCTQAGLRGPQLLALKAEIEQKFGVTWP